MLTERETIAMQLGSPHFEAYNRTLRRIMWADFIDEQMRVAREQQYRASLVEEPYRGQQSIAATIVHTRQVPRRRRLLTRVGDKGRQPFWKQTHGARTLLDIPCAVRTLGAWIG